MGNLVLPCEVGEVSDGYHTFDELYRHRCLLFLAVMQYNTDIAWAALKHADGSVIDDDWFIAGLHLPTGDISYHLPIALWTLIYDCGVTIMEFAPPWDGHTSQDVLERLMRWLQHG